VGVGVALAKAGRRRQTEQLRRRNRRLGVQPGEPLADALQRMALGQLDLALELLQDAGATNGERAVHETRKAIKRLRALLRLLRGRLGEATYAREDKALRDVAKQLAGARDAEVMLATLEQLIERHPRKLGRRKGVRKLRARLRAERERTARQTLDDAATRAHVLDELRALRARVATWSLPDREGMKLAEPGLRRLYEQGRKRYRRAARGGGKNAATMHAWRKRVKDLRYAAEMLERERDEPHAHEHVDLPNQSKHTKRSKHGKRTKRSRSAARLHRVAKRADALGEALGEDHDLAMLAELVRAERKRGKRRKGGKSKGARGKQSQRIDRATRNALLKAIARRRAELRKRTLRDGKRLYKRTPPRFVRRLS
jgi:CHAD domain-containing protein